jgi:hypothetical protein
VHLQALGLLPACATSLLRRSLAAHLYRSRTSHRGCTVRLVCAVQASVSATPTAAQHSSRPAHRLVPDSLDSWGRLLPTVVCTDRRRAGRTQSTVQGLLRPHTRHLHCPCRWGTRALPLLLPMEPQLSSIPPPICGPAAAAPPPTPSSPPPPPAPPTAGSGPCTPTSFTLPSSVQRCPAVPSFPKVLLEAPSVAVKKRCGQNSMHCTTAPSLPHCAHGPPSSPTPGGGGGGEGGGGGFVGILGLRRFQFYDRGCEKSEEWGVAFYPWVSPTLVRFASGPDPRTYP